jgi:PAS domain S-box-containing protein/putative nucleotidyltransferase with HDIG domain
MTKNTKRRIRPALGEMPRVSQAGQAAITLERKSAEEERREIESTLRVFFNSLPGPALLIDRQGLIVEVNEPMARRLGRSRAEIIGQRAFALIPPEIAKGRIDRFETVLKTGRPEIFEDSRAGASYLNYMFPIPDEKNEVSKVAVFALDITERKRAEETFIIQRDLAMALGAIFSFQDVLKQCLKAAITAGQMDSGGVYLIDHATGALDLVYHEGLPSAFVKQSSHYESDDPHTRLVMNGEPCYFPAKELDPAILGRSIREGLRVLAVVPVKHENRIIACLNVASHTLEDVPANARVLIETIAAQIGNAIARKQAEEELRAAKERYQELVESANEAIVVAQDGMLKFANPKASEITGYSREELCSMPFLELVHPDDRQMVGDRHLKRLVGEELPPKYPFRIIDKGKNTRWVEINAVAINWEGRPATLNFIDDITERKQSEEALREREQMIGAIVESSQDWIWAIDLAGRHTYSNPAVEKILGYSAEELQGIGLDLIHPEDRRIVDAQWPGWVEQRKGWNNLVLRWRAKDGNYRYLESTAVPILGSKGKLQGFRGVDRDITERWRAETALRKSEERLREAQALGKIGNWEFDLATGKIDWSDEVYALYERDKALGPPSEEEEARYYSPDQTKMLREYARLAAEKGREFAYDLKAHLPSGKTVFFNASMRPQKDEAGRVTKLFGTIQDITERKRTEEAIRTSEARLRQTLREAINSLSSAIEMRDPYTAGHQEQVAKLAVAVAREMGLSEDSIEALEIAGLVHDIGKLSIPAEILSKPTRLTETEFELVKTHAEIGYTILSKIDFPWPIALIVGQHHERLDGSGYPKGLPGKDLLTESKILAVADTVEAMSSHRPYRPSLGIEAALKEINGKRGILYDPEVVDACVRLFTEKNFRL